MQSFTVIQRLLPLICLCYHTIDHNITLNILMDLRERLFPGSGLICLTVVNVCNVNCDSSIRTKVTFGVPRGSVEMIS